MLMEPMTQLLKRLKLHAMLDAFQRQSTDPDIEQMRFEERLALLLQHEMAERENVRLAQRLRFACLPQAACLEDIDTRLPRKMDTALLSTIRDLAWIGRRLNVLITGPTGVGKSFIGAALAHGACRADYSVRCFRLPRLIDELARAHAFQRRSNFLRSLAKAQVLLIDDFAITPLSDQNKRDLLEILDDRYDKAATIITSQVETKHWHAYLDDPTLADAILDRLVHNAHHLHIDGPSIRKLRAAESKNNGAAVGGGGHRSNGALAEQPPLT
jgi:DNA replication protein DnaC